MNRILLTAVIIGIALFYKNHHRPLMHTSPSLQVPSLSQVLVSLPASSKPLVQVNLQISSYEGTPSSPSEHIANSAPSGIGQ